MSEDWEALLGDDGEIDKEFVNFDEFADAVTSLKLLENCLGKVADDPTFWKWAIYSAHSALQGACVCLLTGTDGLGALADKATKDSIQKLYGETEGQRNLDSDSIPWPEEFIAPLPALLKRLPGDMKVHLPGRNSHSYGWNEAGDLRRLHE